LKYTYISDIVAENKNMMNIKIVLKRMGWS